MPSPEDTAFHLPDLGEGLTEAEIVSWHVSAGDRVVADQPLVTVETDKAVVDIPAPRAGRIERLHADVGERLEVGALLVTYAGADSAGTGADRGAVVGELTSAPEPRSSAAPSTVTKPQDTGGKSVRMSPKARQRARELGVDLAAVIGTGPDGSIQLEDVMRAAEAEPGERLSGVRRAMAERMADAHARVARATVTGEADISVWDESERPMLRLVRAIGCACLAQPRLNMHFDDRTMVLRQSPSVDLGIAMETSAGLFVPVLRRVTELTAETVNTELARLEAAVRERSIGPDELRGQTITLSNFGAVAGLHAEMVVVPPQVAIVGAGRAFSRPGRTADVRILPLSISFDHRVVTGVEACEFLDALTTDLEKKT